MRRKIGEDRPASRLVSYLVVDGRRTAKLEAQMSLVRIKGLFEIIGFHPFWHRKYRREFGPLVVLWSAVFQLGVFVGFAIVATPSEPEMWLLLTFTSFLIGSVLALNWAAEIAILRQQGQCGRTEVRTLLAIQGIALAAIGGALVWAHRSRGLVYLVDTPAFLLLAAGAGTAVASPLVVWWGSKSARTEAGVRREGQ